MVDGHLPAERAEGCEGEYAQVKTAMTILIDPFIDQSLAKRIKSKQWFNLDDTLEIKLPLDWAPRRLRRCLRWVINVVSSASPALPLLPRFPTCRCVAPFGRQPADP